MNYLPALAPMLRMYGPIAECGAKALERLQSSPHIEDSDYLDEVWKFFTKMAGVTAVYLSETTSPKRHCSQEETFQDSCEAARTQTIRLNKLCAISFNHTELFLSLREIRTLRESIGANDDGFVSFAVFFRLSAMLGPDIACNPRNEIDHTKKMIQFLKAFASWAEKVTTPQPEMHS